MAVAQTTVMNPLVGGTPTANGTLTLSTGEQEWLFTSTRPGVLQLISDAAWLVSSQATASYSLVPANVAWAQPLTGSQSVFVKSVAATPTLYSATVG